MFNPTSKESWVYKRWFAEDAEIDTATTFILKTTYKDNRFLPQEYIDALEEKKKTNPTYYRIYALGEFASLDKLVYQNVKIEDFDEKADDKKKLPLLCGLDDSEKIKSIAGITDIICEEATELTLDDVSQLDLRLRANVDDL